MFVLKNNIKYYYQTRIKVFNKLFLKQKLQLQNKSAVNFM